MDRRKFLLAVGAVPLISPFPRLRAAENHERYSSPADELEDLAAGRA